MRTIKFRAQKDFTKDWVYGSFLQNYYSTKHCAVIDATVETDSNNRYKIIPETLGQFTGLTDKNNIEIYEGDLIAPRYINDTLAIGEVVWLNGSFRFRHRTKERLTIMLYDPMFMNELEVVGNIYEIESNK